MQPERDLYNSTLREVEPYVLIQYKKYLAYVRAYFHYMASVSEQFLIQKIPLSILSNIQHIQLSIQWNVNTGIQPIETTDHFTRPQT